jgi:hypothetical protein
MIRNKQLLDSLRKDFYRIMLKRVFNLYRYCRFSFRCNYGCLIDYSIEVSISHYL